MRKRQFETERLFFSYWLESDSALADELWGDEQVTQFIAKNGRFSKAVSYTHLTLPTKA